MFGSWTQRALGLLDDPDIGAHYTLTLEITDTEGMPLEARVRVRGSDNGIYPGVPNRDHLSYDGAGGYCYASGSLSVTIPKGSTRVTVGRGFEYVPYDNLLSVECDTTVSVVLERLTNLGTQGWFCGEIHAHSQHPPLDYLVTPEICLRIARAEGLSILHLLDDGYEFTGAPHPLSDRETILYFAYEYRNQAYGHCSLPGLREPVDWGCCLAPDPAYPMLLGSSKSGGSGHGPDACAGPSALDR